MFIHIGAITWATGIAPCEFSLRSLIGQRDNARHAMLSAFVEA